MTKPISYCLLLGSLFAPCAALATSGWHVGNGGNPDALDFLKDAQAAISTVQADPANYPQIQTLNLENTLDGAQVLVSESPLYVTKDNVRQEAAAINFHNPDTILLARDLWNEIRDPAIKKALALHEVLGLAGVEDTGQYFVSEKYLASLGVHCSEDLCVPQELGSDALLAAGAQQAFENTPSVQGVLNNGTAGLNPYNLASGQYDPGEIWSGVSFLIGASDSSTAMADLSQEGTTDWIEWSDVTSRKMADTHVLPDFSYLQPAQDTGFYVTDARPVSWGDGYPTVTDSGNRNGISVTNGAGGLSFTAPADQNVRTLVVHVSEWEASGRLTAELEDGTAVVFRDFVPASDSPAGYDRNYTLTYSSRNPTRLKVNWFVNSITGNVNLSAAALSLTGFSRATSEISGSWNDSTALSDLTKEGTSDWIHWGDLIPNRKATGGHQISDFSKYFRFSSDSRWVSWSDGASGAAPSPQQAGAALSQLNNGFVFKIPVDSLRQTLTVHLGGFFSGGIFTATLDDGSGYAYSDEIEPIAKNYDRNYALTFNASKPSTLTVIWKMTAGPGSIFINAMSLR